MPRDMYHGEDGRALGRRVKHLLESERIQVSCVRCERTTVYGWETFKHFRWDCPIAWLEAELPPNCWRWESRPADCVREVVILDASPEDVGCSDEG